MCQFLQHPSARVTCDPPADPREPPHPPTEEEWALLEAWNGIDAVIRKYGAKRVMTWVRNLATIQGQEV